MRYMAMQVLTWGTIVGATASALMLAAMDPTVAPEALRAMPPLTIEPPQAGRVVPTITTRPPTAAASAPTLAIR